MNRLPAIISSIDIHGSIALVEAVSGSCRLTATLVGASEEAASWHTGMAVTLLFKETEVSIAKNLSGLISLRNRIAAVVLGVERGKLLSRVDLQVDGHRLASVITTRAVEALGLAPGDAVEALVKANEVTVLAGDAP
jgi:molybdate transport system regulatory protein